MFSLPKNSPHVARNTCIKTDCVYLVLVVDSQVLSCSSLRTHTHTHQVCDEERFRKGLIPMISASEVNKLTPRVLMLSGRLDLVLLHTCFLTQHMRYQKDLGLGMMLNGGGRVAPSSK